MREQIDFSRRPEFEKFMAGLTSLENAQSIIHGIFIDLHPIWKSMVDFATSTGVYDFYPWDWRHHAMPIVPVDITESGFYDLANVPESWKRFCEWSHRIHTPFIVKIYVLPTAPITVPLRRTLERYAREQPFFVTVIDAPMPVLAATIEGGLDISATISGTLGGFLTDQNGACWGVTCGHVAQSVNGSVAITDAGGTTLPNAGTVMHSNFAQLQQGGANTVCNPYVGRAHSEVDTALVKLSPSHTAAGTVESVGLVDTIFDRTQLNSGSAVTMRGANSGHHDYRIGGYGYTSKVQLSGTNAYYCFSNVFDFQAPGNAPKWIPRRLVQALVPWPLQGDSGAWVCFNYTGNRYAYFGNLIAVRGATGIATFADAVTAWADNNCGGLRLAPL